MLHISKVLKIVPAGLQPAEDVKCRDCIHAQWIYERNKKTLESSSLYELSVFCKQTFTLKYHTSDINSEVLYCDSWSNEIKDDEN